MPNWTYNTLHITGKHRYVNNFIKSIVDKDYDVDFNKIVPEPKTKEECEEGFLIKEESHVQPDKGKEWFDWYRWHCHYWGTKWNACETRIIWITRKHAVITFDTAWNPPTPIMYKIMAEYCENICISWHCVEEGDNWDPFTVRCCDDVNDYCCD